MTESVIWCNKGFQPVFFGFCPSEKAWHREMKRLELNEPYPTDDAHVMICDNKKHGKCVCIVTLHEKFQRSSDKVAVGGLLAHEAVHVWQEIRGQMGERNPSIEFEAYTVQGVLQELWRALEDVKRARRAKRRKAK